MFYYARILLVRVGFLSGLGGVSVRGVFVGRGFCPYPLHLTGHRMAVCVLEEGPGVGRFTYSRS